MRQIPSSWHSDWRGIRAAILGLGKTGFSVADTLVELGCHVTVFAEDADAERSDLLNVIGGSLVQGSQSNLVVELQRFAPDLIVVSPGFAPNSELVQKAAILDAQVWTDIDLAWNLRDKVVSSQKWILITGTNGKTTVTEMTTAMLQGAGLNATACGNIGTPILDAIRDPAGFDFLVVEISSFQLHYLNHCEPEASVLLNIAEDHLDWHGGWDEYKAAKAKVFENTRVAAVYNRAAPETVELLEQADVIEGCRAIGFTLGVPARSEIGYVEDILVDRAFLDDRANSAREIISISELKGIADPAPHVLANVAAATALALAVGVSPAHIRNVLTSFTLSSHRIQLVADQSGIKWINDSKATNAHAADAALRSFDRVIWIMGGLFKGVDIIPLIEKHRTRFAGIVLIGVEQEYPERLFAERLPETPVLKIEPGERVMERAVSAAHELAKSGDTVLLAPAAASMDQFVDYADRGEQFMAAVRGLIK